MVLVAAAWIDDNRFEYNARPVSDFGQVSFLFNHLFDLIRVLSPVLVNHVLDALHIVDELLVFQFNQVRLAFKLVCLLALYPFF